VEVKGLRYGYSEFLLIPDVNLVRTPLSAPSKFQPLLSPVVIQLQPLHFSRLSSDSVAPSIGLLIHFLQSVVEGVEDGIVIRKNIAHILTNADSLSPSETQEVT
jgi:hypothetical protein